MPLFKEGAEQVDHWTYVADDDPIPTDGDIIVSFERFHETPDAFKTRQGQTGVLVPNTLDISELSPYLPSLTLVALQFPAFADGRAYSQAWHLRNELGFEGEVRATGNVLADQAAFMLRSGFDSFEVEDGKNIETIKQALAAMTHAYQPGFAENTTAFRRRIVTS